MKLLFDENLPPRLAVSLADLFPNSAHISDFSLSSTPDSAIWEFAREHGFVFLTKDKDFAQLSNARGAPPQVILLQTGNCSTRNLLQILRRNAIRIGELENSPQRNLLILT